MVVLQCEGPCLKHCYCSRIVGYLAYASMGYLIATVVYMIATRCFGHRTPFKDSLSEAQLRTLAASKRDRSRSFLIGVAVAVVILVTMRPLRTDSRM